MSNKKIAAEYRQHLYRFLREQHGGDNKPLPRDLERDKIVIKAYERSLIKLGINPDTEDVLKEVQHDNHAVNLRLQGFKCLETIFYEYYKNIVHVIENKYNYIGKEAEGGIITGISNKCICVEKEEHKKFFWYLPPPLHFNNCNAKGAELAKYLIKQYGE